MAVDDGLTGAEMMTQVCNTVRMDVTDTAIQTRVAVWLNSAQRWLFNNFEWPELLVLDGSFTTDASDSYDLTSAAILSASFGKLKAQSVRIGTRFLESKSKVFWDSHDAARTIGGTPWYYGQLSRTDFRLYPYGDTGSTVYLDYYKYPDKITYATVAADQSFEAPRHDLIVQGAMWEAMFTYGIGDWKAAKRDFEKDAKQSFKKSSPIRESVIFTNPTF